MKLEEQRLVEARAAASATRECNRQLLHLIERLCKDSRGAASDAYLRTSNLEEAFNEAQRALILYGHLEDAERVGRIAAGMDRP